ncbi:FtsK/SpoIIIE domain-containing protein [Arthrobacter sp. LAPM80]|uniref:FtsK/SpoIIIE domain-containing protein n=1 Tax=Arthrobacter sp. LAPM80 TaxID=3141788 RepID=UPI00398B11C1
MLLEITVVAGPGAIPFPPAELTVTWPQGPQAKGCTGRSLQRALERHWPGCLFTVGGDMLAGLQPGIAPLVNGAVVVSWPAVSGATDAAVSSGAGTVSASDARQSPSTVGLTVPARGIAAVLSVCSGPGAGAVFALHRGSFTFGRGRCQLSVADPSLSRHHGTVHVGPRNIMLATAPGSSGFTLRRTDGSPTASAVPVKGTVVLEVGCVVACGSTAFELRVPDAGLASPAAYSLPDGGPWLLDPAALEPLVVKNPAGAARNRVAMLVAGLFPLVVGVVLALVTGSWMFLAFSAMGALTVLVPVLGGSRRRRIFHTEVERAARQDAARRSRLFPDAGSLVLASGVCGSAQGASPPRARPPGTAVALRIGSAAQPAAVAVSPDDPAFPAPVVQHLPLCIPLGTAPVTITGPATAVVSMLNHALMQLDAASVPVVLLGPADAIPLAARFLPLTWLATSVPNANSVLAELCRDAPGGSPPAVLVAVNVKVGPLLASIPGLRVACFDVPAPDASGITSAGSVPSAAEGSVAEGAVALRSEGNNVVGTHDGHDFIPDGVPPAVFDAYARRRAWTAGKSVGDGASASLEQWSLAANILPRPGQCSVGAVMRAWAVTAGGPLSPVPLGQSGAGPLMFDFLRDGPHLLVGGTTGSGKSELLRTLVGSLALAHSPADLQFVFLDFKGGAGLAVLGKLPHTTSLITDLGGHGMDRALASLRAEIRRREAALASVEAADSRAYRAAVQGNDAATDPGRHTMAHLVVVIDEFRVLVDQFPDAMAELMRIAAVGRSLGIHLVMATQRPQGAVNADIRANVTSSICLRVQSVFDSTDVIGTGAAAGIGPDTPGRAYICRAGGAPEEFQSATLGRPGAAGGLLPTVEPTRDRLSASPLALGATDTECDVPAVAGLLASAWQEVVSSGARQDRPGSRHPGPCPAPAVVAPELPAAIEFPERAGLADAVERGVALGLVDVPQLQKLEPLLWHPQLQSHLAFIGTSSETANAVSLVAGQLLSARAQSADADTCPWLLYLLDGDGSLGCWADSQWVGSCITPHDLRTAAHLVRRLGQAALTCPDTFVLCISDWGHWVTALRSSPWHEAENGISELLRFSPTNVVVVLGGGRELVTSQFMASIPNRLYLTCGSSSESTMLWPRLPRFTPFPGRAAIAGPVNEAVGYGAQAEPELHIAQLGRAPAAVIPGDARITGTAGTAGKAVSGGRGGPTLSVSPLPRSLTMAEMLGVVAGQHGPPGHIVTEADAPRPARGLHGAGPPSRHAIHLALGLGGDGRHVVGLALAPGTVLPVIGGPGSGKSSFLAALALLNGSSMAGAAGAAEPDALYRMAPAGEPDIAVQDAGILMFDDAASLPPTELQAATQALALGTSLVAAFPYPGPALSALPLEWGLRTAQQGVVLMPQRPGDADLFGVRLDTVGAEPPGRAVLIEHGRHTWFQFPFMEVVS